MPQNPGTGSNVCEVSELETDPQTPDMMIVLDRSGSMGDEGRWEPSVSAVRAVTMALESQIRFGLALFPAPFDTTACDTAPDPFACLLDLFDEVASQGVCAPGDVVVPVSEASAGPIGDILDVSIPSGGTPTAETLEGLLEDYAAVQNDPDTRPPPRYVLLVTDGQPTCPAGRGSETNQADIDASNLAIEALAERGVRTYVVGYDTTGPGNEMLAEVLDGFAQRGDTGDTQHRPVEDEQSLVAELESIAGAIASCSFALDEAPPRADHVLVELDGAQVNLDDPDGWQLVGDRTIELVGGACERLQDGDAHYVEAEVRCQVVAPR